MKDSKWIRKRFVLSIPLILVGVFVIFVGGILAGKLLYPRIVEVEVTAPRNGIYRNAEVSYGSLDVIFDEVEGELVIKGFKANSNLWLGRVENISMFPTFRDGGATIIEEVEYKELNVGDIIAFIHPMLVNEIVVKRISKIGEDGKGWYADVLADNSSVSTGQTAWRVREGELFGRVRVYIDY